MCEDLKVESVGEIKTDRSVFVKGRIIIFATALLTAVVQTNVQAATAVKAAVFAVMAVALVFFIIWGRKGRTQAGDIIAFMIFFGMLLRSFFVLTHDIYTLQNDSGTFTGFGTEDINIGHLGYIEYIYKFGRLPNMDPYDVFGYFHPPVHHLIEALWLMLQRMIGVEELVAFENLQIPTLIYSGLCMLVMLHILLELDIEGNRIIIGMVLLCFYPRMMVFAGSVNNDILALLLLMTTIWRTLVWIRKKTMGNILFMALSLGLSMITKLNTAICVFSIGLVLLVYLVAAVKEGNLVEIRKTVGQYVVFGVVSFTVGMSYILRNLIMFGKKPGLPTQGEGSVMYFGDYPAWSIIGIPTLSDLNIEFPFHPISGDSCHNTWVILFQTGLFAEGYPADIGRVLLLAAQIGYVASIAAAIIVSVVFLVRMFDKKLTSIFMWSTFVFMLLSYMLYMLKYPYTCSGDFRYMAATLVFASVGYVMAQDIKWVRVMSNVFMALALVGSLVLYIAGEI